MPRSCTGGISFLLCPFWRLVPNTFRSLRKNTAQISTKFAEGHRYHEQIKWLRFRQSWNRNKETEYEWKFESMLIDFAAMSNRYCRGANEFANFAVVSKTDNISSITYVSEYNIMKYTEISTIRWRKGNINKNCLCVTIWCTIIMVHKDTSSSYRSVDYIGLWSCLV